MRVAQTIYNKAHWIFTTGETMEQLKSRFAPDLVFIDITDKINVQEGWDYDAATGEFGEPVVLVTKNSINATYLPQFQTLQQSYTAALLTSNTTSAASIQSDYQALIGEYNAAMEAVKNGR